MDTKYSEETLKLLGGPVLYPLHPITLMFLIMRRYSSLAVALDTPELNTNKKIPVIGNSVPGSKENILNILYIMVSIYDAPISNKKALLLVEKNWLFDPSASYEDLQAAKSQSLLVQDIVIKKFLKWVKNSDFDDYKTESLIQSNLQNVTLSQLVKLHNAKIKVYHNNL